MDILGLFPLVLGQVKFLIMGVDYFTKWIEAEIVAKITTERVLHLYRKKIMCMYELPGAIIFDNRTLFSSAMLTNF